MTETDAKTPVTDEKKSKPTLPAVTMSANGLVPTDIDQAYRMAQGFARAGDMVPRDFQGRPDMIFAAIESGLEIGLAPMQALRSIAVINGRACIWGDALPALAQRAGHHLDVEITGEGDNMVATATLERGDTGRVYTRTFSVEDAKRAGLWGNAKKDPWIKYPKRMLMMRARSWAMRDGAADAMMGLSVAEEAQDFMPIRDVTPEPRGFAKLATDARQAAQADPEPNPTEEDEQPATDENTGSDDVSEDTLPEEAVALDGEIMPDEPEIDEKSIHVANGLSAAEMGFARSECPKDLDQKATLEWFFGFDNFPREG